MRKRWKLFMHRRLAMSLLCLMAYANASYAEDGERIDEQYTIPDIVLHAIQNNECYNNNGYCDPNVIRINKESDIELARQHGIPTKGPHILCYDDKQCAKQAEDLIKIGIQNIDLGPYQINYHWNGKYELSGYFNFEEAKARAKEILTGLVIQYGYSWTTLGRYHNYDAKNLTRNCNYYKRLQEYVVANSGKKFEVNPKYTQSDKTLSRNKKILIFAEDTRPQVHKPVVIDTYQQTIKSEYSLKQENLANEHSTTEAANMENILQETKDDKDKTSPNKDS